jgi:hypothetical protein
VPGERGIVVAEGFVDYLAVGHVKSRGPWVTFIVLLGEVVMGEAVPTG